MSCRLDAARRDLREALATARAAVASARARHAPRADELAALQRDAHSGALGPDMRTLAHRVRAGTTTWDAVLDGTSPDADLARDHVDRMAATHGAAVRSRLSTDLGSSP